MERYGSGTVQRHNSTVRISVLQSVLIVINMGFALGVISDECVINTPSEFTECPAERTVVVPGQEINLKCSTQSKIEICNWIGPTGTKVPILPDDGQLVFGDQSLYSYQGNKYECNIRIKSVRYRDHGMWTCQPSVKVKGVKQAIQVQGSVIVAGMSIKMLKRKKTLMK